MNKHVEESNNKSISFKKISWGLSIFSILVAISCTPFGFHNILFLICALIVMPPIVDFIKLKFNFTSFAKWGIFAVLFLFGSVVFGSTSPDSTVNSNTIATLPNNNLVNSIVDNISKNNSICNNAVDQNIVNNIVTNSSINNHIDQDSSSVKPVSSGVVSNPTGSTSSSTSNQKENPTSSTSSTSSSTPVVSSSTKQFTTDTSSRSETSSTVWIGKTGSKYHRQTCPTLKGGGSAISLSKALDQGRTACKVCKP